MRILTIVGARPQFVKAAMLSRALHNLPNMEHHIVHTGQHYDQRMSEVFFAELGIPRPLCDLQIGSGPHGMQTGRMIEKLEQLFVEHLPEMVLVFGDTNSTLAGALSAAKLHIPVAHVEAGLRSFNRRMPEEINRVMTDHLSTLLFCPTEDAVRNLRAEGITRGVHLVGDVMYDCAISFLELATARADPLGQYQLREHEYILMTCHRAENTDDPVRLAAILRAAQRLAGRLPVLFPVHPRTRSRLGASGTAPIPNLQLVEPVSYFEMLALESNAAIILTDSGGVQKEAFFYGVPCVTMRDETEWVETVEAGANRVVGANTDLIVEAAEEALENGRPMANAASFYGNGQATQRIASVIGQSVLEEAA